MILYYLFNNLIPVRPYCLLIKLLVITAVKILVIGTCMITLAGAAIGTGVLFAGYTLSAAKNPEEADNLFNTTLMAFALIETFVFISFVVAIVAFFL